MVRLLAAATVAAAMGSGVDLAHATNITWSNGGPFTFGLSYNCSYYETRMSAYVGYGLRPGNRYPAVGEVWYAHVVIAHVGVDCAGGGSPTDIHFVPPPNTQLAVSADDPLFCFWRDHYSWSNGQSYGNLYNMASSCNQNPPWIANKGYSLHAINPTQVWWIPQYDWMEFLIPLRSTATEGASNNLYARINPELGVVAYPSTTAFVTREIIFRDGFDGMTVFLDLCTIPHTGYCGQ
jgi:hypothetical protein